MIRAFSLLKQNKSTYFISIHQYLVFFIIIIDLFTDLKYYLQLDDLDNFRRVFFLSRYSFPSKINILQQITIKIRLMLKVPLVAVTLDH